MYTYLMKKFICEDLKPQYRALILRYCSKKNGSQYKQYIRMHSNHMVLYTYRNQTYGTGKTSGPVYCSKCICLLVGVLLLYV